MRHLTLLFLFLLISPFSNANDIPTLDWQQRSDWTNVQSFGAVGDGVNDDSAAIQSALDTVKDGSVFYFPPGTYRLTQTITLSGPHLGILIIGHGKTSELVWDGADDTALFIIDGISGSRYVGLSFDGKAKASIGLHHDSPLRFSTEVRHQHLAFRNFRNTGIRSEPSDGRALAETSFENCLFEDNGTGVSFTAFNDYNYSFDGSEFRRNTTGIRCRHGNFYVRNCHFEESVEVDIFSKAEHACSVRRCTSLNSKRFLEETGSISPITIQDCHVQGWTATDGAMIIRQASSVIFDCSFTSPPNTAPPISFPNRYQQTTLAQNSAPDSPILFTNPFDFSLNEIPQGKFKGTIQSASQTFLKSTVLVPTQVFDAKVDFGAIGDGIADDTEAIQNCIDAAREHGQGAIAYLPTGRYQVTQTLRMTGKDYTFGGTGFRTFLRWQGEAGGTLLHIEEPDHLTLENISIGHHDAGQVMNHAIDILQSGSQKTTHMTYDSVFVYGLYQKQASRQGLHLKNLGPNEVVVMPHFQGNLQCIDSARALILGNATYEGSVTIKGESPYRDGFLGFMTRLSTANTHAMEVRDNHSVVMSDFYIEQTDNGFRLFGDDTLPPGRLSIHNPKYQSPNAAAIYLESEGYRGEVLLGANQFYREDVSPLIRLQHTGSEPLSIALMNAMFYDNELEFDETEIALGIGGANWVDESVTPPITFLPVDRDLPATLNKFTLFLDDMRRLGIADQIVNHQGLTTDSDNDGASNVFEFRESTDPFDDSHIARYLTFQITPDSDDAVRLSWPTDPALDYQIYGSPDLSTPFQPIEMPDTSTGDVRHSIGENKRYFYRVRSESRPDAS